MRQKYESGGERYQWLSINTAIEQNRGIVCRSNDVTLTTRRHADDVDREADSSVDHPSTIRLATRGRSSEVQIKQTDA